MRKKTDADVMKFAGIWSKETASKIDALIKKERRRAEIETKIRDQNE